VIDSASDQAGAGADLKRARRQRSARADYAGAEITRLPPNSIPNEQGSLGCCLLAPRECIPACITFFGDAGKEVFYDLRHQTIWDELVQMSEANIAIDLITVRQRLKDKQLLEQVGGISYLAQLQDAVPSAANIEYYLGYVMEKYILRRDVQVCTEIVGRIYDYEGDAEQLQDEIERDVLAIRPKNTNAVTKFSVLIPGVIQRIEDSVTRKNTVTGIPTGFADYDVLTGGMMNGDMIVIAARPSLGKAQPLTAKVLTPEGFKTMGEISVGDLVIGRDGSPHSVLGVFPQGKKSLFEVKFSDGTKTQCCDEHLWFTQTRNERRSGRSGSVKSLKQIRETIYRQDGGKRNHVVPLVSPVNFYERNFALPLHPWLLGALIGDGELKEGNILFSKPEQDVQEKLKRLLPAEDESVVASKDGMTLRIRSKKKWQKTKTATAIESLGLRQYSETKFIPKGYLFASANDRLELLRGLLDTDGYVIVNYSGRGAAVEYTTSSEQLAKDVVFLVRSLGALCSEAEPRIPKYTYKGEKKNGLISYRMNIWFDGPKTIPVSSDKHPKKWEQGRHVHKSVESITACGVSECKCIQIDAQDGLYVTDDFIITHNTSLLFNIAENVVLNQKIPVGIFSLEMTKEQLAFRTVCSAARVNARNIAQGFASEADYPRLIAAAGRLNKAELFIDDTPGLSILNLRARARRMVQQFGIKLFGVDYLQLLHSASKRGQDNRQQEVSEISEGIKALAKELRVPIIVLSQLNRSIESSGWRKPRLSDLRESGQIEADADIVCFLYKPQVDEDEDEAGEQVEAGPVNLLIAKSRNGPTGDVRLTFLRGITRFESAAKIEDSDMPDNTDRRPYTD